jgi:magnesium chelatase family protein
MILEIPRENIDKILNHIQSESSETLRNKVISARKIKQKRFAGTSIFSNAQMGSKHLEEYISLDQQSKDFLIEASKKLILSPRVVHRTIKLARTIADME